MTDNKPTEKTPPGMAREAIVKAAIAVFSEKGIKGATTKEIARVAKVNETTLFRHFESKDVLLKAVVESSCDEISAALADSEFWVGELRADLTHYAHLHFDMLVRKEPMIRTFISEIGRDPESAKRILQTSAKPFKARLLAYFQMQQDHGHIRPELNMEIVRDMFTNMLLGGMLNRKTFDSQYETDDYIANVVELLARGIESPVKKGGA